MGHRTVKRVPLAFDWPLRKVWEGYLSPYSFPPCPDCGRSIGSREQGDGLTPEARAISQTFYPHMIGGPNAEMLAWHDKIGQAEVDNLIAEGRLRDYCERWNQETGKWEPVDRLVTAELVNAGQRGSKLIGTTHDAINRVILVAFRCKQLGILRDCPTCEGYGDIATAEERRAADEWEGTEPPAGEGWQLWETVSEGSPISLVFTSASELANWAAEHASLFAGEKVSAAKWLELIKEDQVDVGSLLVTQPGYIGALANRPK